ncbi:2-oxoacid:acceptor oxidoreductase subunit alpha [Desulfosporosinus sp.]|uniref:2-oxoacid:acceptor oxidoreductase subunit alpha n=1 Tax=Desulfosporosinus sp. TaxID=157907 RepID=UPI000E9BBEE5|nr:2-oxoacid:acceptor oxidoreductase subunit alpha [Desulfosporosinus sp.]MBC2723338.1 2-oxoacid:acceptor oxidoreductase subunit alpha [Desulfosporosinus sp.]MBC2727988.1 2-oxoacid:acceptor oxidoreductase subunit alpha [Desulfosporosinus sp.]HBV87381.1 2-oxoacid:acceptor oxidoreductase subunit alpha [Desulfosporosinus sp.]
MNKARLMQGNEAVAEGALAAGVLFYAGYPITPSTEIAEKMAERLPLIGGTFIQMEDEIGSMAAIIGASLTGVKSLTATSGPGFSLKQENLGYAIATEVPCVVVNVQRGGPSTGLPTSPAQADVMQARWGTHGDHPIIALTPSSVQECYELTVKAFNMAEEFRIPVILLMDEVIGHLREKVVLPEELTIVDRKRSTLPPGDYIPYENNESMIPAMANFGEGYRYHVTGLTHNEKGLPTGNPEVTKKFMQRLTQKLNPYLDRIQLVEELYLDDAELIVIAYGCTARSAMEGVHMARNLGIKVGLFRPITIWPFPQEQLEKHADRKYLVVEMNNGQLVGEIERIFGYKAVERLNRIDGELITPKEVLDRIREVL